MMTKLTDTQAAILTNAAQHRDGLAAPPASLPPAPRGAVAKAMIKAGLLQVAEDVDAQHPGLAWKLDGEVMFLCITDGGRAAIGSVAKTAAEGAQGAPLAAAHAEPGSETTGAAEAAQDAPTGLLDANTPEQAGTTPASPQDGANTGLGTENPDTTPTASKAPLTRTSGLRDAARQVLAAWDDSAPPSMASSPARAGRWSLSTATSPAARMIAGLASGPR